MKSNRFRLLQWFLISGTMMLLNVQCLQAQTASTVSSNLLPPLTDTRPYIGWTYGQFETAEGTMVQDGNALKFAINRVDGTDWHVQVKHSAKPINGELYELRFRAKADTPRPLTVQSEVLPDSHWAGLAYTVGIGLEWQTFALRFAAQGAVDGKNILPEFWMGQKTGTVWLSDISLVLLPSGSSLAAPVTDMAAWGLDLWGKDAKGIDQPGLGPKVAMAAEGKAARFIVTGETKNSWSACDTHVSLKENVIYTLTFRARADAPRPLTVMGEKEPNGQPSGGDGLWQQVAVTPQWQPYTTTFTTKAGTSGQNKLPEFIVGDAAGTLWLSDVALIEGSTPAPAAAPVEAAAAPNPGMGPKPRPGEIKLTGTVMEIHLAAKTLLLAVTTIALPDGTATNLPAPRPKTILLNAQTLIVTPDLTQKTLAELKEGTALTVIGKDSGVGKPLTVRTILLP